MKVERTVRCRHFNALQIGRLTFTSLLKSNNCRQHTLPDTLEEALSKFGHLEIYTDPLAQRALSAQVPKFVSLQALDHDLVKILKNIFPGDFTVLAHAEDTVCIVADPKNQARILAGINRLMKTSNAPVPRLSQRDREIAEVIVSETSRGGSPSKRTPPLAVIERDTSDGALEQGILTRLLQSRISAKARGRR